MFEVRAYAASSATSPLKPFSFQRRDPLPTDIQIEILYCGVCHSDLHTARNEWTQTIYPVVPGHEILGRVVKAGSKVTTFREGDIAAVGCMVGSCGKCRSCQEGLENYCENGNILTYNSEDPRDNGITRGGYSESIVVNEAFALRVPRNLDPAAASPLLCAGITTYSPLRHWKAEKGKRVGIVGLGGLGHMAVKFANSFGARVAVFTTSPNKTEDAIRLGAHEVIISRNEGEMTKNANSFDFILDTVSAEHDINAYLNLLKRDGTLTLVGAPEKPLPVSPFSIIPNRRGLAGSLIGGIRQTQEMLDYCGDHGIVCDIETIGIQKINEAYERMLKSDVKYRFVIDMASLRT
jgi:uncharacterized zinc-type alcohol dehydrogenase-like protein